MSAPERTARPSRDRGWASPDLLAGWPVLSVTLAVGAILVGSFADTIAFKTALDLLLHAAEWQSWVMAVGATLLALVAAAHLGMEGKAYRRGDQDASGLQVIACLLVWVLLGATLVYVRWTTPFAPSGTGGFGATAAAQDGLRLAHAGAVFFGALYLISGVGMALVATRLTNPAYRALRRSEAACERQEAVVARLRGEADRARNSVAHHSGEYDRDLARRDSARAERQALGADAANYARVLMAQLMRDPRKTGVTDRGPVPGPHPVQPAPGENNADDTRPGRAA